MSIFRPEALTTLKRWREPAVIAVLFVLAIRLLWLAYSQNSWVSGAIGLAAALIVGSMLYVAYLRARLRADVTAPGIVEIRERHITYFSPENGGEVDLDTLRRLQLSTLPNTLGNRNWVLWHAGGSLVIPVGADGADELIEAFAALPGIGYERILHAMQTDKQEIFTIWSSS